MRLIIDSRDRRRILRNFLQVMAYLLMPAVCLLVFAAVSEPADSNKVMDDIKLAVLRDLAASVSPEVELIGLRVIRGMDIASGNHDYVVLGAATNGYSGRNKVNYMIALRDKSGSKQQVLVEASYDVLVDVFVYSRALAKGNVVGADSFYSVKQKVSGLPLGAVLKREEIEGKILKMNISQGIVIRSEQLSSFVSIKKGQKVDVVVEGSNVILTTKGVLRKDVPVGGVATVFCDIYKKEVSGILLDANTVKVKI